jgi:phosphohistidine phosphatase
VADGVAEPGGQLLWLLRHATTVADPPPGATDHDRALTPAGRRDAEALGRRVAADGLGFSREELPAVALCSTARRAVQTAEIALSGLRARLDLRRRLYHASPEEVLDEIRTVDDEVRSVIVVGHNPTLHRLAIAMIDDADEAARRSLGDGRFPTCGVAVYRLGARRWRDVAEGTGVLAGWFAPPY